MLQTPAMSRSGSPTQVLPAVPKKRPGHGIRRYQFPGEEPFYVDTDDETVDERPKHGTPKSLWDPNRVFSLVDARSSDDIMDTASTSLGDRYVEGRFDFEGLLNRLDLIEAVDSPERTVSALAMDYFHTSSSRQDSMSVGTKAAHNNIKALDWTKFIVVDEAKYVGGGAFGDVFEGKWENVPPYECARGLPRIVVKRFRVNISAMDDKNMGIRLLREIAVWHILDHENIVPFVGISEPPGRPPALISERMFNGAIKDYISKVPSTCLQSIITGIARGLDHLHGFFSGDIKGIIHGDLKADNVLVNRDGRPCLCDFGLSRMLVDNTLWNTSATHAGGTLRWMAPELLPVPLDDDPQPSLSTRASDIYAFAMTCYEVLTGNLPYHNFKQDHQVFWAITQCKELPRPDDAGVGDELWSLLKRCWSIEPAERPSTSDILCSLMPDCCPNSYEEPRRCFRRVQDSLINILPVQFRQKLQGA